MSSNPAPLPDHPETSLESVEEIRKSIGIQTQAQPIQKKGVDTETVAFRPVHRPSMAILCAIDDGIDDGEVIRIRSDKFVIGRADADLVIPHDSMISKRHAEIARVNVKGGTRWFLSDLRSRNGTFVRVSRTIVIHGQEILLGSRRFRFDSAPQGAAMVARQGGAVEDTSKETRGWQSVSLNEILPSLLEITPEGADGQRFTLNPSENWLGRAASQCNIVLGSDPMLSPRHARLALDDRGRWQLENAGSRNGTWIRVQKIALGVSGQFQLGEQRFHVRILS